MSLPIRLPEKIQKPKWAKSIKTHGKASARSLTGPEAAEREADQAETKARKQRQEDTTEVVPLLPGASLYTSRPQENAYFGREDTWQSPDTWPKCSCITTVPGNVLTSFTSIYNTS
jgi:hypothetical protein